MDATKYDGRWVYSDVKDIYDIDQNYPSREAAIESAKNDGEYDEVAVCKLTLKKVDASKIDVSRVLNRIEDSIFDFVSGIPNVSEEAADNFCLSSKVINTVESRLQSVLELAVGEQCRSMFLVYEDQEYVDISEDEDLEECDDCSMYVDDCDCSDDEPYDYDYDHVNRSWHIPASGYNATVSETVPRGDDRFLPVPRRKV